MSESQSNDPFFKMFTTAQTCDFCRKTKQEINRIILHAIYTADPETGKISPIGYQPAKKCKKCCQEQS